jgi:hypothetical protein
MKNQCSSLEERITNLRAIESDTAIALEHKLQIRYSTWDITQEPDNYVYFIYNGRGLVNKSHACTIEQFQLQIDLGEIYLINSEQPDNFNNGCNHEWTELTLFTSVITYCPKCNKERE